MLGNKESASDSDIKVFSENDRGFHVDKKIISDGHLTKMYNPRLIVIPEYETQMEDTL